VIRRDHACIIGGHLTEWLAADSAKSGIALFLDFDGTLVGICDRPEQCILSASLRALITELSEHPQCTVAIVSGRPTSNLKSLIAIPNIHLAGNHGLFIEGPGYQYAHPEIASAKPRLDAVRKRLVAEVKNMPGIWIDAKPASCALHYRQATQKDARRARSLLSKIVQEDSFENNLRVMQGKKVLEVLPAIAWHKGEAVLWLLRRFGGRRYPVYIGDDRTDEDAFRALSGIGLTIRVGRSAGTAASYFIRSHDEVRSILTEIYTHLCGK